MVITLRNKQLYFRSAQLRYALIYMLVTSIALVFLNIYASGITEELFFNNKKASMIEKCKFVSVDIADLNVQNAETVANAVANFENLNVARLIITNEAGKSIYDSFPSVSQTEVYTLFPEIVTALYGNDVFYWRHENGAMISNAATPIYAYNTPIGCVYMSEIDTVQGTLISKLQTSIFIITLMLELVVILFSALFVQKYFRRLRKIMNSIRTVKKGDYSNKLNIGGNDELSSLSDEFNDLISRLQTSERKRSQFFSDASHELKTPLASIKLLSDSILQNEMDAVTVREFVGDIGKEADRLNRMSQKLLALSKSDAQLEASKEITYFVPTIQRVVRMLSENAKSDDIELITSFSQDFPVQILEDDLSQIIFNLVENGIKYNRKNGKLEIVLQRQGPDAVLTMKDTGIGIPEEALGHIFDRFFRVDKARSRSTGGSGLGLSIVHSMVERNNGRITVESTVGEGTSFTLSFPIAYVEEGFE